MENIEVWQVYIFDGQSMHFSLAKNTLLVIFILVTVLNNVSDNNLSPIGIIAFLVPNIVIVIFGLIWINKN